ncbi:ABC transporter permease [Agrobacterium vitis]|nr:ABC transporter permease [Agrobacterium vitis]
MEMTLNGRLPTAFFQSMQVFFLGFAIATLSGISLGLVLGRSRSLEALFGFYLTAGNSMPMIAVVPLFILWFGLGFGVKVAIIAALSFFPICISTWDGVRSVPKSLVEVGRSFVGSRSAILFKIVLPASVPSIMAGLRLAVGKGVIALVIAEFLTSLSGLGGIILSAANNFDTAEMLAPIVVLLAFAVALNAVMLRLERFLAPWHLEVTG